MQLVSFSFHLFLWSSAVRAIAQNITIDSTANGIQYLPTDAWSFSSPPGVNNGTFAHAVAENATVIFNISVPATAFFWRGYLPSTAARYSICIDCADEEEIGDVVTLDATPANYTSVPVILFASKPLGNSTHTVFLRNIRNSIEGVVGEMAVDSFLFTADSSVTAGLSSSSHSSSDNKLIIAIAVICGVIGILVGAFILLRLQYFRRKSGATMRPLILVSGQWKRKRRKGDLEAAPMITSALKNKPPITIQAQITILDKDGEPKDLRDVTTSPRESELPYITVTSPTTIPTSASTYSTTHDIPLPPPVINPDRGAATRQSDPYVSYAAAYAAFAGIENDRSPILQISALRDSVTLPPPIHQERTMSRGSSDVPPSSFNGRGIRSGNKGKRTLSDKIKRGTLPPAPKEDRTSISVARENGGGGRKSSPTTPIIEPGDQAPSTQLSQHIRPPLPPNVSTRSSPRPVSPIQQRPSLSKEVHRSSLSAASRSSPQQVTVADHESSYWNSQGDLGLINAGEREAIGPETDLVLPTLDGQGQPTTSSYPDSLINFYAANRSISPEGESNTVGQRSKRTTTISMITNKTANTSHTTHSSISFTPSVSEFPMPPFNVSNDATTNETAGDDHTSVKPPNSRPNTLRSSLTASTSETGSSSTKSTYGPTPPSAFPQRQRRPPRLPPSKIIQLGLAVPVSGPNMVPMRKTSSTGRTGFKRRSSQGQAKVSKLPFKGEVLSFNQPKSSDVGVEEIVGSTTSLATTDNDAASRASVPFYMAASAKPASTSHGSQESEPSLNPSRLTMGSMLTTTDEEYASGVQVVVATRGVPPDLPRAIKQVPSPLTIPPAESNASGGVPSGGSSNGKWEMVYPKPGPPQGITPISISKAEGPYRPNGPTANVPVSAITDRFEGGSVEGSIPTGLLDLPTAQSVGTGSGMPWSPNFLWPATPPIDFTTTMPSTSGTTNQLFSSQIPPLPRQLGSYQLNSVNAERTKQEHSIPASTSTGNDNVEGILRTNTIVANETSWKDVIATTNPIQKRSRSNSRTDHQSRLSTYSTASSFFGGRIVPIEPPLPFPLDTPLPTTPVAVASSEAVGQPTYLNIRQGLNTRSPPSQSPVSPRSSRPTGSTALNVNAVFATSGSLAPRPKLSLQRVSAVEGGASTPSRIRGPRYSVYPSPSSTLSPVTQSPRP